MTPTTPGSASWRAAEARSLLNFGSGARHERGGFGWLTDDGSLDASQPRQLWINARMTHVFGLAAMANQPSDTDRWRRLATEGVWAMSTHFADSDHGGWFAAIDDDGMPTDPTKATYSHAFVILAAATAAAARIDGAASLLDRAMDVMLRRFWSEQEGACVESFTADWACGEDYRGANANMHAVEAFIACADVTGDLVWRERALRIARRIMDQSRQANWRLPEHFSGQWAFDPEYNRDNPADKFRPFGATPGHWLEWARLLLNLHHGGPGAPDWLLHDANAHFQAARAVAWAADGQPGFVYTLDWQDRPVVRERMHWVIAEGTLTADAIARTTADTSAVEDGSRWWVEIAEKFVDRDGGSWWHALDVDGQVSRLTWNGKPDIYHAYQACIFPDLSLSRCAAASLRGDEA